MKKVSLAVALSLVLGAAVATGQAPEVAHLRPKAAVNEAPLLIHAYGSNFQGPPVTAARLSRPGDPDIVGTAISVTSDIHVTCSLDVTGANAGLYDLILETSQGADTLQGSFTVYRSSPYPHMWSRTTVGSMLSMLGVCLGDGNNDDEMEVYGANADGSIYQFKQIGMGWSGSGIGFGEQYMYRAAVGDGNNDGGLEVYGSNADCYAYQFTWSGFMWEKRYVGSGGDYMYDVAVGDGNSDGELEVYGANLDGGIYQFKWDGANWVKDTVGITGLMMYAVAIEDGDNDEQLEIYGGNADGNIYQFKWNDPDWTQTIVGSGGMDMRGLAVADGNGDGVTEVYGACWDYSIYQFAWTGSFWDKTTVDAGTDMFYDVTAGDGDGDGEVEIYAASQDDNIYEYWWDGGGWQQTPVGSGAIMMYGVAAGDGNGDGEMEVYGADWDGSVYQFKVEGVGVSEQVNARAGLRFSLRNNPSFGRAVFDLTVPGGTAITLRICDTAGRILEKPLSGEWVSGTLEIPCASTVPSGVYFYLLDSSLGTRSGKMVLVR